MGDVQSACSFAPWSASDHFPTCDKTPEFRIASGLCNQPKQEIRPASRRCLIKRIWQALVSRLAVLMNSLCLWAVSDQTRASRDEVCNNLDSINLPKMGV